MIKYIPSIKFLSEVFSDNLLSSNICHLNKHIYDHPSEICSPISTNWETLHNAEYWLTVGVELGGWILRFHLIVEGKG